MVNPERHNLIGVFSWGHICQVRCHCCPYFFKLKYIYIDWDAWSVCQDHTPPAVDQRQHEGGNMSTSLVLVIYNVKNIMRKD